MEKVNKTLAEIIKEDLIPLLDDELLRIHGNKSIEILNVSDRCFNSLEREGIGKIEDLKNIHDNIRGLGSVCVLELIEKLGNIDSMQSMTLKETMESTLDSLELEIIYDRFGLIHDVRTLEDIALRHGLTRERIRQKEKKALLKIRKLIDSGVISREFIIKIISIAEKATPIEELEEIDTYYKKDGIIRLVAKMFPELITVYKRHENREYLKADIVVNTSAVPEISRKIQAIRKVLWDQTGFVEIKEITKHFDCPDLLVIQEGTVVRDGYIALKGNKKIFGDNAVFIVEETLRKARHPLSVRDIIEASELSTEKVRYALWHSKETVNVGDSIYALKEQGFTNMKTKDLIIKFLEEADGPLPFRKIANLVQKYRLITDWAISNALQDKELFQYVDSDNVVLRRWEYEVEYEHEKRKRYEVSSPKAVISILEKTNRPLSVAEISEKIEMKYKDKASSDTGHIYNTLTNLIDGGVVSRKGTSRSRYYDLKKG